MTNKKNNIEFAFEDEKDETKQDEQEKPEKQAKQELEWGIEPIEEKNEETEWRIEVVKDEEIKEEEDVPKSDENTSAHYYGTPADIDKLTKDPLFKESNLFLTSNHYKNLLMDNKDVSQFIAKINTIANDKSINFFDYEFEPMGGYYSCLVQLSNTTLKLKNLNFVLLFGDLSFEDGLPANLNEWKQWEQDHKEQLIKIDNDILKFIKWEKEHDFLNKLANLDKVLGELKQNGYKVGIDLVTPTAGQLEASVMLDDANPYKPVYRQSLIFQTNIGNPSMLDLLRNQELAGAWFSDVNNIIGMVALGLNIIKQDEGIYLSLDIADIYNYDIDSPEQLLNLHLQGFSKSYRYTSNIINNMPIDEKNSLYSIWDQELENINNDRMSYNEKSKRKDFINTYASFKTIPYKNTFNLRLKDKNSSENSMTRNDIDNILKYLQKQDIDEKDPMLVYNRTSILTLHYRLNANPHLLKELYYKESLKKGSISNYLKELDAKITSTTQEYERKKRLN